MRTHLTILALLLASPALAAENEVSAELGVVIIGDSTYDRFDYDDALPSWGLRGGARVHDHFAVIGSLRWGRQGVRLTNDEGDSLATAFSATELAVGIKGDVSLGDHLAPYALVNLTGFLGQMQLDDDARSRTNPGQIRSTGLSLGGNVAAGFAVRFPNDSDITPALHLEVGWTGVLPHGYSVSDADGSRVRIGTLGFSSPAVRGGFGIRF